MSNFGPAYPGGAGHSRGRYTAASEKAARSIDPNRLSDLQKAVLAKLLCAGDEGATVDEIVERMPGSYRYTLAPRLNELHRLGWIEDTGLTRTTPRGGEAIVWRALAERRPPRFIERRRRANAIEERVAALEEEVAELRAQRGGTQRRLL